MSDQVAAEVPIRFTALSRMSGFSFARNSLILLVAALLLAENGPSVLAIKHCKNAMMDVIMKHCSGARFTRDLEHVKNAAIPEDDAVHQEPESSDGNTYDKRQVNAEAAASAIAEAAPIVMDMLQGNHGMNRGQFGGPNPYQYGRIAGEYFPRGGYPPFNPYGSPGGYGGPAGYGGPGGYGGYGGYGQDVYSGFQGAGDNLGMDLTSNEVEELYKVYERLPRASMSKEDAKKLFIEMAAKCCQNLNNCILDEKLIPCT
ncbi:uncharacterized protein LOC107272691 [Cephus cinctus]|uniref:Uncharacterized protein LOC107272691 n=1 Tax=Cephus cinctus TaxID=211228 RepID=A0AAJ7CA23_CEPCN|nr:uncharacterized protein LOC107272691 [Cephus cinctus]